MPWKLADHGPANPSPLQEQEFLILGPYLDLLDTDDVQSFVSLLDHVGISLDEGDDPLLRILQHYWLGGGRYDLRRAANDLATFPPVAAYLEQQAAYGGAPLN
jgi:hypothetical protein